MKKILIVLTCFCFSQAYTQKNDNALRGERCITGDIFFNLSLQPKIKTDSRSHSPISDSTTILVPSTYNIYLKAYNPLHYTHKNSIKITIDPILGNIWDQFVSLTNKSEVENSSKRWDVFYYEKFSLSNSDPTKEELKNKLGTRIALLSQLVMKDESKKCLTLTKQLFDLDFKDEIQTRKAISSLKDSLNRIEQSYTKIKSYLDTIGTTIEVSLGSTQNLDLSRPTDQEKYLILDLLNKLKVSYADQLKRVTNLSQMISAVEKTINAWQSFDGTLDDEWYIFVEAKYIDIGEEHKFDISIEKHNMSIDGEKVTKEDAVKISKHFTFYRFNWFFPEFSAGTIYSFQKNPNYTTRTNDAGQLEVTEEPKYALEQLELTAMLNWNMYLPNTSVSPFFQIGIGINNDVPLGLAGAGLRFELGKNRHIAISGGWSLTGIKELNDLNLGSVVKDDSQLKNDLKYELSPVKGYFGIQYNF